jgi:uncharacterized protein YaiI (UPF0178 family)
MGRIYIDGDACAVKKETYKVAVRHGWSVRVVANHYIQTPPARTIVCITVSQGADVADDWIAERCDHGDVVITNDIPLAARCLEKGARVLGQKGREFTPASIGEALGTRELFQNLREVGVRTGGPKPMAQKDRSHFLERLDAILVAIAREAQG